MPFIFGMRSQDLPDAGSPAAARLLADIVLVDIDRGIIGGDFDELPRLPIEPLSKLFSRLRGSTRAAITRSSGRFKAHDARQTESHFDRMEDGARWAFLALWAELLCEYKEVYVIVCVCVCVFLCCACLSPFVFVNSLFMNDIEALVINKHESTRLRLRTPQRTPTISLLSLLGIALKRCCVLTNQLVSLLLFPLFFLLVESLSVCTF